MSRTQVRVPDRERTHEADPPLCPPCGTGMRIRYENRRTLVTLTGTQRLRLKIRRCEAEGCARFHRPYARRRGCVTPSRSTSLAWTSWRWSATLRHREHRSVPEIHARSCAGAAFPSPNAV